MRTRAAGLALAFFAWVAGAAAEPLPRDKVPDVLKPWTDWVLHGREDAFCSFLHGSESRRCLWPSWLLLELGAHSGRFTQDWLVQRDAWVPLPGDERRWPFDVRVDGKPATIALRGGAPSVRLERGAHGVSGSFAWDALPEILPIPPETALVSVALDGAPVAFPHRDPLGQLWLGQRTEAPAEESRLDIVVHRRVIDEVPLQLATRIELRVAGASREVVLGRAFPERFLPMSLDGPLPARLETDGRLRVQVRPGRWTLDLLGRHDGPVSELSLPALDGPWAAEEVWAFEARNHLRLVSVEGVPSIDPQQTELPTEWRQLPAYRMLPGATMKLVEKRRGDADPAPDRLSLQRAWWLDFDGRGFTIKDQISGTMSRSWRLEMPPPTLLGRAALDGRDQFITRRGGEARGLEIRAGQLQLEADSRIEGGGSRTPAVGWSHDFHEASGQLNLPPGWRLFHATGVDDVSSSWIASWTLLDLFVVLVTAMAVARLFGWGWGAVALGTLALSYPEAGAPRWVWLAVVVGHALARLLPAGRLRAVVSLYRLGALVALVIIALGFAADQVRLGLYPQLERSGGAIPSAPSVGGERAFRRGVRAMEESETEAEKSADVLGRQEYARAFEPERYRSVVDPNALIPTGPGLPRWSWNGVALRWRGPVDAGQELRLWLMSPRLNLVLAFVRVALSGLLLFCMAKPESGLVASGSRVAGAVVVLAVSLGLAGSARAELPSSELLDELRTRLLENPECFPQCASSPRLDVDVERASLVLRLAVDAAAETAVPLPGGGRSWSPARVLVDGRPAVGLARVADGSLWLAVPAGQHQVLLEGPLPASDTVEISLPLRPHRVEARAEGWTVGGLHEDGLPDDNLQLVRVRGNGEPSPEVLQPGALPAFVRVERLLHFGLSFEVETHVTRVTPAGSAVILEVPLLPGESVTTPEVRVAEGKALVSMGPSASEVGWHSILPERPSLALVAPPALAWTELWRLDVSPIWHVEVEGVPPIHGPGDRARIREWRPWPGETVTISIGRPEGAPGQTLTVDQSVLETKPGLRTSDTTLTLEIRASRGGQHRLTLPEGAELQTVSINGVTQPIRLEGRTVTIPTVPGSQTVSLAWREAGGIAAHLVSPVVEIGVPSVNAETRIAMPADRWTLFVGGARVGPAVLFWGVLVVVMLAAAALARLRLTPLGAHQWFLLGVGLTQAPASIAVLVAGWLLALCWRRRRGASLGNLTFDLLQVTLLVLTILALTGLFSAIRRGLLGLPEMQISGNGSSASLLRWYHDRTGESLPRTWAVSVPLMAYRAAMLAWALWLASALLRWLRWGWECFSEGGLWRSRRGQVPR